MPAFSEAAGQVVRTGKREPKKDPRTLRMASYVRRATLYRLPRRCKRSPDVENALKAAGSSWGMMANDVYGDCTCASFGHMEQIWTAVATPDVPPWTPNDAHVLALYNLVNGGHDWGAYMLDVLNAMRNVGLDGHRIEAYVQINKASIDHIRYAIDEFGSAYVGLMLPASAQSQTRWRVVRGKDAEPGSWGGHAVNLVDYDRNGFACVTWGEVIGMTYGFWKKYGDEAYACLSADWLTEGQSPHGFNVNKLQEDLAQIT